MKLIKNVLPVLAIAGLMTFISMNKQIEVVDATEKKTISAEMTKIELKELQKVAEARAQKVAAAQAKAKAQRVVEGQPKALN
ncbi:hypothetical protein ELQ35_11240 [Peribacillus cavernae]|uniref:Uncharacterized protein n=1 Tax=Peribacillus cavernae TaxID=1674310 RepID=A0A3S0VYA4_9BACI|nr:hypothetical protein [Peribacillus cavernae]MDQ0220191.1 hypothetical protein [Peribacillus cavernae]RUQ28815.1 hypothetical protein ELQ35_11240 [Peribacillus cavernae]